MLKLQSKGGKFDIVLSDASLKDVGSVNKNNVRSLSSAGRRKSKEVKGHHILSNQKDVSPRLVKGRESRLSDDAKSKNVKVDKKTSDKQNASRPSKDSESMPSHGTFKGSNLANARSRSIADKTPPAKKQSGLKTEKRNSDISKSGAEAGVITHSQLMSIVESLKEGDVSVLQNIAGVKEKNKESVINRESITDRKINARANPHADVIEPTFVPGLDLHENDTETQDSPYERYHNSKDDRIKEAPYATLDHQSIISNPPTLKSKDSVSTISIGDVSGASHNTAEQNAQTSPHGKAERIAMRSSFAIGAPGQVAFDYNQTNREKNKQWLADLEKQIQEKKQIPISEKEWLAKAMEDPASVTPKPIVPKQIMVPSPVQSEVKKTPEKSPVTTESAVIGTYRSPFEETSPGQASFARGQHSTKTQFELDEIERQRKKIMEHQRAVELQVEEKRRMKMLERERRIKEELEEEEKLAKEREQLALQHEMENRKQMEREEAERQRHEALQRSVLEAYDAAKKEKLNARLQKLKARGHDVSRLEHSMHLDSSSANEGEISEIEKELSRLTIPTVSMEPSHMVSSRSDKEFRPILNLTDESYDQKEKERNKVKETMNKDKKKTKNQKKAESHVRRSQETEGKSSIKSKKESKKNEVRRSSFDGRKTNDHEHEIKIAKGAQKGSTKRSDGLSKSTANSWSHNSRKSTKKDPTKSERLLIKYDDVTDDDMSQVNTRYDDEHNQMENITLVPTTHKGDIHLEDDEEPTYKRSSTVNLDDERPSRRDLNSDQRRASHQRTKEDNSNWDTWTFPTERQQQILDQLQALRKGLLEKQREYERGTTPSTGDRN